MPFSRTPRFFVIAATLILIFSASLFLINFSKQSELARKTLELEVSINQVNFLYRNFLEMVIQKRNFQVYQDVNYKTNFERLDSLNLISLDSLYTRLTPNGRTDRELLDNLDEAYQKRLNQLKSHIGLFDSIPTVEARSLIFSQTEQIQNLSTAVEFAYQNLLESLLSQSELVGKEYYRLNNSNFFGFIVLFLVILFLIILNYYYSKKSTRHEVDRQVQKNHMDMIHRDMLEFRTTFDFAAIGMAVVGENGSWVRVNPSLQRMLGYTEEELKKMNFQEITHPEDLFADLEQAKRLKNREIDYYTIEKRYITKSGEILWINLNGSAVWEEDGRFRCFIAQVEDISSKIKNLEQLQEQNEQFGNVIEGTRAGTWEWNVQTGETIFNETWANIIGYTLDEISPVSIETWMKFTHADDLELSNQRLQACFSKASDYYECECRMKHKSGHWVWVLDRGKVMTWTAEGRPEKMYGTHIDISKFKELEFDLMTKKAFSDAVLDTIDVGIVVADQEGKLELFNKATLQFHGLDSADIPQEDWSKHYQLLKPDLSDFLKKEEIPLFRAWSGEHFKDVEFCIKNISGEIRHINCSGSPFLSAEGEFLGAVVAMNDISIHRIYEQAVRDSELKFRGIFNSMFQFIGFLDRDGTLLEANQTALDFGGLQIEDVKGKKFWDCHWWKISEETQLHLKESVSLAAQGQFIQYEVAVWDRDFRPITILFNLKPILDDNGLVIAMIPEGRLIQDIVDARRALEDKNSELLRFAAVASHDLKEPLRMVINFLQLLQKKYDHQLDEKALQYIHYAVDASQRMNILISELLEFSKIGIEDTPYEWVEVDEVLIRLKGYFKSILLESEGEIKWEDVGRVWVQRIPFELLLRNLLGNSLKYRSPNRSPIIHVSNSEKNGYWEFRIEDNGIGFESEFGNSIFQMFKRLHTQEEYSGTGMGLATCKRIVEQLDGEIWATSEPGMGSVFNFTIAKHSSDRTSQT